MHLRSLLGHWLRPVGRRARSAEFSRCFGFYYGVMYGVMIIALVLQGGAIAQMVGLLRVNRIGDSHERLISETTLGFCVVALALSVGISLWSLWAMEQRQRNESNHDRIEETLRKREEQYRTTLNASHIASWDINLLTGERIWNDVHFELLGLVPGTVEPSQALWQHHVHPDDIDYARRCQSVALQNQGDYEAEYRIIRADGAMRWVLGKGRGIYDEANRPIRMVGVMLDMTDRKQMEEALRQSERQNRAMLSAIPDIIYRIDSAGCYLGISTTNTFADLLPPDTEPMGQHLSALLPAEIAQRHLHHTQLALATNAMQIYEQKIWVNDHWQYEEVRAVKSGDDEVLFMVRDISDRKQLDAGRQRAEQALRQKNQELAHMLEQLQVTQEELIQSEKMAALGQLMAGIAHEINTPLGAIRAASGNVLHALEESLAQLPQLIQALSVEQQIQFFHRVSDLRTHGSMTAREKRQWKRSLTQQLEQQAIANPRDIADTLTDMGITDSLDDWLPLLTHAKADVMLQLAYNLVRLRGNSQTITTAVERAAKIVFALKSYTHQDHRGHKILAQVTDGLDTVLMLYHNQLKQGIEVIRHYDAVPPLLCYPDELNQVWTNLIHNAIQAMTPPGQLELSVRQEMDAAAPHPTAYILVSITDNGSGIPADVMPHIFTPFFTTKTIGEGSGLGLDISRKIVAKHEGRLEVESMPGCTTFRVWLPILPLESDRPHAGL